MPEEFFYPKKHFSIQTQIDKLATQRVDCNVYSWIFGFFFLLFQLGKMLHNDVTSVGLGVHMEEVERFWKGTCKELQRPFGPVNREGQLGKVSWSQSRGRLHFENPSEAFWFLILVQCPEGPHSTLHQPHLFQVSWKQLSYSSTLCSPSFWKYLTS